MQIKNVYLKFKFSVLQNVFVYHNIIYYNGFNHSNLIYIIYL